MDVTICPDGGGEMRMIAAITDPNVVRQILSHIGLPTEPPSCAIARGPPDEALQQAQREGCEGHRGEDTREPE